MQDRLWGREGAEEKRGMETPGKGKDDPFFFAD